MDCSLPTFLVFGGSLGARQLNTVVLEAWGLLNQKGMKYQVVHVTGTKDFERVERLYSALPVNAKRLPYCHDMARAYAAADAVICRAGASTVAELLAAQRPAFLVPYPHASNNQQVYNAEVLEKAGWGVAVLEKDLTAAILADYLTHAAMGGLKQDLEGAARLLPVEMDPHGAAARLAGHLTAGTNLL